MHSSVTFFAAKLFKKIYTHQAENRKLAERNHLCREHTKAKQKTQNKSGLYVFL
jgi:hypothetical protein